MIAESLSLKTDLIFWRHHGVVLDRGEYFVVHTPRNPEWRWGHVVAFKSAPTPDVLGRWADVFEREFANAPQPATLCTWDKGELTEQEKARLGGCTVSQEDVMVLDELHEPGAGSFEIRPVEFDEEWAQLIDLSAEALGRASEAYRKFLQLRYQLFRELAESGSGKFFAALNHGHTVGALGIFHEGDLYRYQEVVVAEEYRKRGIATALIVRAVKYAQSTSDDPTIVICARARSDAARLYSQLGFAKRETAYSMSIKRQVE